MDKSNEIARYFYLLLFLLVTLFFLFKTIPAYGRDIKLNPTGRDISLVSLLKISDTVIGEASITITPEDVILLPKESTLALLSKRVTEKAINKFYQVDGDNLTKADFQHAGLDLDFDLSTLECIISVPYELSATQNISVESSSGQFGNYAETSFFSGYINANLIAIETQAISEQSSKQRAYNGYFDTALNIGRLNFEYESLLNYDEVQPADYSRLGTRMNIDFFDYGTRFIIGDVYSSGRGFQDDADALAIGITRDFTLIPARNVRPKANRSFTLLRTSSVDVVIDGVVMQRLTLGAGSYNLNDIPLAQGTNDIELVITDSTGQQERIRFSITTGQDLLDSGEYEYSLVLGVLSEFNDGKIKYLDKRKLLHYYLDVGIFPWLTLGINSQMLESDKQNSRGVYQYGGSALIATPLGITQLSASYSDHFYLRYGRAYQFSFDAEFDDANSWQPQLSFLYQYTSANFAGISSYDATSEPINNIAHSASLFGSIAITENLRAAITGNYSYNTDANFAWSVSPSLSGQLFDTDASWSLRINYQVDEQNMEEVNTSFTLSVPINSKSRLVGHYSSAQEQTALEYSYQDNVGNTGGVSAFASATTSRDSDANVNLGTYYTANRFVLGADHTTRMDDLSGNNRNHVTRLQFGTALAFAGSSITVGRPVGEAFAVINKHQSLAQNNITIDPSNDSESARVYNPSLFGVLVPDLVAYNSQVIGYEVEDLPPGYDLGDGAFWLKPGYKQGYQLQIGSDAVITAIGTFLNKKTNDPITLVAGTATYLGSDKQQPLEFFTNRKGLFAITGMKPGKYNLTLDTKERQSIKIDLSGYDDVLIRLGELYVE